MRLTHPAVRVSALLALAPFAAAQGQLHTVDGTLANANLGSDLVRFHDLDGDGWREFLAGSPSTVDGQAGRVAVISGRFLAQGTFPSIQAWFPGTARAFGAALIGLEDFDGDGDWDFAVGAPDYVVGNPFGFPFGQVSIWDENGAMTGQITGPKMDEALGSALALVHDLNGDGFKDVLACSPSFSGNIPTIAMCGKAAIYSGANILQNQAVVLRVHLGDQAFERFGSTLATGFFDADAVIDYAIGTPWRKSSGGVAESGRVSVYNGATGALIRTINGGGGTHFGAGLAAGLDVTADGVHDLVIGAPYASTNGAGSGTVYVYSGAALGNGGLLLPTYLWHGPSAGAHFGSAIELLRDVNGDGDADVAVGAPDYEPFLFGQDNGLMRIYSGETGELLGSRTGQANEHLGGSFVRADPWDGKPGWEFLVGSPQSALGGASSGRVASYSIFPNAPTTYCTSQSNSKGCTPAISGLGQPSVVPGTHFNVKASNVLNNVPGLLIYSYDAAASPFQGGFVCVGTPVKRTSGTFSNGTPPPGVDCTGSLWFDFNAYVQSGADPFLYAGQEVFCQFWSRDTASASGSNLTNGLRFLIHP